MEEIVARIRRQASPSVPWYNFYPAGPAGRCHGIFFRAGPAGLGRKINFIPWDALDHSMMVAQAGGVASLHCDMVCDCAGNVCNHARSITI